MKSKESHCISQHFGPIQGKNFNVNSQHTVCPKNKWTLCQHENGILFLLTIVSFIVNIFLWKQWLWKAKILNFMMKQKISKSNSFEGSKFHIQIGLKIQFFKVGPHGRKNTCKKVAGLEWYCLLFFLRHSD